MGNRHKQCELKDRAQKLLGFTDDEAYSVFEGRALDKGTSKGQYRSVIREINDVLRLRGLKTRIEV